MSKNKKPTIIIEPSQEDRALVAQAAQVLRNDVVKNGFCDAMNFGNPFGGQFSPIPSGFPGGVGSAQQIEDTTTLFTNLRWYMVSNFRQLLSQCFVEIGLIQTICVVPVDDGLRGGVTIKSQELDEQEIKELQNSMEYDDDLETAKWAAVWDRLYGGAGILTLVDDQDPETPLSIKSIGPDTDVEFRAVDMWELFWDKQNTEGYDPQIQSQNFEFYSYYSENVHKSRVMRMKGIMAPSFIRPRLRGWGVSVVEALVRSINQYLKATDLSFEVLDEFKIDVFKMKNLINTLLGANGTNQVKQRVQMANWQKNFQHAIVMDSEDDYDHKQLSFSGLAETMGEIRMQVAADMRIPITKLFGTSVSHGFQTDQNDMENYNALVESEVRSKLKYHILKMLQIKCQKLFNFVPDDLEIEFKPLRELNAEQVENCKTQKFNRVLAAKTAGELSTLEFRDACNKDDLLPIKLDTVEDGLNPNDIEAQDIASGNRTEDDATTPGADKEESREVPGAKGVHLGANNTHVAATTFSHQEKNRLRSPKNPIQKDEKNKGPKASKGAKIPKVTNSAAFDRASYEADGGDAWIDPRRRPIFENPGNVDEGLWAKAKEASTKAFGKIKWQFVTWWYKKQGGKFK